MNKVGIFYATISGSTRRMAKEISLVLNNFDVDIHNIIDIESAEIMLQYDLVILGSPTYGKGDMHYLMYEIFEEMQKVKFQNTKFAIFCLGDQKHHQATFGNALFKIYQSLKKLKVKVIGFQSVQNYTFKFSPNQLESGDLPGLILDQKNQSDQSSQRIKDWCSFIELTL